MRRFIVLVGCLFAAVCAQATTINPGSTVAPSSVAAAVGAGSTALLTMSGTYNFNALPADISGSYVETAYADTTNPFNTGPGVYDTTLVLKITVGAGTATVERATLGYFSGMQTSVSYLTSSSAVPTGATRDSLGSVIGYNFAGLTPGQIETLVIYTDGQGAAAGGTVSIQDGTAGYNVGIMPTAVPEPLSSALAVGGIAFLGLLFFTKRA